MGRVKFRGRTKYSDKNVVPGSTKYILVSIITHGEVERQKA